MKLINNILLYIFSNFTILIVVLFLISIHLFISNYITFSKEEPIAIISFEKLQDQEYEAKLYIKDFEEGKIYKIYGDQWRLDAYFYKWKYYASLFGIESKYRLDRIEGRYKNIQEQNNKKKKSYQINKEIILNKTPTFINNFLFDIEYGSSVFKDIEINKIYTIYKNNTGFLIREKIINKEKDKELKNKILDFFN